VEDHVILVDESDRVIGSAEKLQAHREGKLHRAFSIFIFNQREELLLQKRSSKKYHSGGLWSNTCCSHPRPDHPIEKEAHRKLQQEMGFDCDLKWTFQFTYRVDLDNEFVENEVDHVFFGQYDGEPSPNPEEVEDWKWMDRNSLETDIKANPQHYTYWLWICFDRVRDSVSR
jgi:isopentenyl-diphosphate Delta-isomerase